MSIELTVKQAAKHKGVTKHTIRRWLQEGRLDGYKVNGKYGKPEWRTTEKALYEMSGSTPREECFTCNNKTHNNTCLAYEDINDPITDEEGRCIGYC